MWHIITREKMETQRKEAEKQMRQMVEEGKRKAEARKAWEASNPPCPHCGRKEPLPIWLQM